MLRAVRCRIQRGRTPGSEDQSSKVKGFLGLLAKILMPVKGNESEKKSVSFLFLRRKGESELQQRQYSLETTTVMQNRICHFVGRR